MNYNEEMALLFDILGIDYKIEQINDKAKSEDYINIENNLKLREEDNKRFNSNGIESPICLSLTLDRRK